ncbi:MAG: tetratricopeptide (TPR) repeat protein [Alphaproteobacteria bacterium]|jgi:tetratricopeptide (TPR) repeat protein
MSYVGITHKYLIYTNNHLQLMRVILIFTFLFFCVGCASTEQSKSEALPIALIFADDAFPEFKLYEIEQPEQIFALDDDAKAFVHDSMSGIRPGDNKAKKLIRSIFDRSDLDLVYESSANTTATDTFNSASANCLSLSIMTYAMAQEAGFSTQFQIVDIPEYWMRRGGYTLISGHVNLRITVKAELGIQQIFDNALVVDFDPQARSKKFFTQKTSKQTIVAMFYNNKGADALLQGNSDKAYAYFKEAILISKKHAGTWVNLGFLYRKMGLYNLAHKAYRQAIAIDEDYNTAWENLAFLYDRSGNKKGADDIRSRLESKRMKNPFYHQMLAEIDKDEGSFDSSVSHYEKAIRLDNNQHQFYFGLASVYFEKGDLLKSQRYLKLAKKKAGKRKVVSAYVNKLDALSTYIETIKNKSNLNSG